MSVCLCLLSPFCFKKSTRKGNGGKKKSRLTNVQLALEGQLVASERSDEEKRHNPTLRCVLCLQILSAAAKVQIKSCTIQRGEMVVRCVFGWLK